MRISQKDWSATGVVLDKPLVCQYNRKVNSNGLIVGDNPFDYSTPVFMAQLVIFFFITRFIHFVLKPLHQTTMNAQIMTGLLLSPSFLASHDKVADILFPPACKLVLETLGSFGFMIQLFVIGVKIDYNLVKKTKTTAKLIGLSAFLFPLAFGFLTFKILSLIYSFDKKTSFGLGFTSALNSWTSTAVISTVLAELNILNSELGRLVSSVTMICDALGWILTVIATNIGFAFYFNSAMPLLVLAFAIIYYSIMLLVLRPLVLRMIKNTPEGKPMKETHIFVILMMVLGVGFVAEYIGQHASLGVFVFGLSLPDGPPLGTILVQKLDTICSGVIFPIFCTMCGIRVDTATLGRKSSAIIELVIFAGYVGKFAGIILTSLLFQVPLLDALLLALLMCCRGVSEAGTYTMVLDTKGITEEMFTLLVINMLVITAISTLTVGFIYDPSRRYRTMRRRSILQSKQDPNFRMLSCIYSEENVPPTINLIEISNATRNSPISLFVLHLMELTGRSTAILVPHYQKNKRTETSSSEHIVNAFKYFERQSHGNVIVQHFTAIAPYPSMHDDICTLALDKYVNILILPFHKQWGIDGTVESSSPSIRSVNINVLDKAPCSVGVLIDRGQVGGNQPIVTCPVSYRVAMLFLGGSDDLEGLAYARRMAEHSRVTLTVVYFKPWRDQKNFTDLNKPWQSSDIKTPATVNERIAYREEVVKDGVGTTRAIRSMADSFDLVVVGRHHDPESTVILGLTEWNECPELGIIGDMLATSDFRFSVLVVQQPEGIGFPEDLNISMASNYGEGSYAKVHHLDDFEDYYDLKATPMSFKNPNIP